MLDRALIELLDKKPIERITVKEICELADINRATFYRHYDNVFHLLKEKEDSLYQAILSSVKGIFSSKSSATFNVEICRTLKKNKGLCFALLGKNGDRDFLDRIIDIAHEQSLERWARLMPDKTTADLERLYRFISNGSAAVIQHWVKTGMNESPEEIAFFIEKASENVVEKS